ncbi:MAG TPA: DUF4139 domain-containing protein [Azospirillum sp.]|nr:DUF4139 domain-containing protein [Azospirillum sp.]
MLGTTPLPWFAAAAALLTAAPALGAGDLPLRRVLLSSGGVGYFEHEASVDGDTVLTLDVRRDQVDDVLKSIVVYDDTGRVGTISLPGEEPLNELFRELPFGPDALTSPMALFNALRGAEVRAQGVRDVTGRLLAVTETAVTLPNGSGMVTGHRVSLMTPAGVQQLVLEETNALQFTDPRLQEQVDAALAAIAQHNTRERRRLSIHTTGPGKRTVRVAYVAAAPLWKASYRLTLPAPGSRTGDLQGWAVLENMSGEDWKDVELTVVSGQPVTFRQALYTAYYVNRPEVPVDVLGRILPKADEGSVGVAAAQARELRAPPAPPASAPAPMAAAPPRRMAETTAADASETDTHVVFRYPQPVSVTSGHSLLLPIVTRSVSAEAVDLFQPQTHPRHPLAAVRLTNDTQGALPPGVLTLYRRNGNETTYIGDAQLMPQPAGEQRLLSFALDQQVKVDRADKPSETLSRAVIADGMLSLTVTERLTTTYTIAAPPAEPRTIILEHPRRSGWDLITPDGGKPMVTATAYRIPVDVPAGGSATLSVTLEHPRLDRLSLSDLQPDRLVAYASSAELPPAMRDAFRTLANLRSAVVDRQKHVAELERTQADTAKEQDRLRQNLGALPHDSDLYKRSLTKMTEQETRLEALDQALQSARKDADAAGQSLTDYIRKLRL